MQNKLAIPIGEFVMTPAHVAALAGIKDGANIFSRGIAVILRHIQRNRPDLLEILSPRELQEQLSMDERHLMDDDGRQCYFGATLTPKGKKYLAQKMAGMLKTTIEDNAAEIIQGAIQDTVPDPAFLPTTPEPHEEITI